MDTNVALVTYQLTTAASGRDLQVESPCPPGSQAGLRLSPAIAQLESCHSCRPSSELSCRHRPSVPARPRPRQLLILSCLLFSTAGGPGSPVSANVIVSSGSHKQSPSCLFAWAPVRQTGNGDAHYPVPDFCSPLRTPSVASTLRHFSSKLAVLRKGMTIEPLPASAC